MLSGRDKTYTTISTATQYALEREDIAVVARFIDEETDPYVKNLLILEAFLVADLFSRFYIKDYLLDTHISIDTRLHPLTSVTYDQMIVDRLTEALISRDSPIASRKLTLATQHGCTYVTNNLMKYAPSIIEDHDIDDALNEAAKMGNLRVVNYCVNALIKKLHPHDGATPENPLFSMTLVTAATHGHLDVVQALCGNYHDDDFPRDEDDTRLHLTTFSGDHQPVISFSRESLNRALFIAAEHGHRDIARFLVKQGANNLNDAMVVAAQHGHAPTVAYLARKGASNLNGAMVAAAQHGHLHTVDYLLEKGANDIERAFSTATGNGKLEVANYLANIKYTAMLTSYLDELRSHKPSATITRPSKLSHQYIDHRATHSKEHQAKERAAQALLIALRDNPTTGIFTELQKLQGDAQFPLMCASHLSTSKFKRIFDEMMHYYSRQPRSYSVAAAKPMTATAPSALPPQKPTGILAGAKPAMATTFAPTLADCAPTHRERTGSGSTGSSGTMVAEARTPTGDPLSVKPSPDIMNSSTHTV